MPPARKTEIHLVSHEMFSSLQRNKEIGITGGLVYQCSTELGVIIR